MKKILIPFFAAALAAGCATVVEQGAAEYPNPFADYGAAMASDPAHPMAVEWQDAHAAEIAAATTPEALKPYLESIEAAAALLAEVKPGYATDPLKATQIAAITQLVMTPGCEKAKACRRIWVTALTRARNCSPDAYRRAYFNDQLNWCGYGRETLWPEGKMPFAQDHQVGAMTNESGADGFVAAEHPQPYIEWCVPPADDIKTDACMVLISGGGYECCCDWPLVDEWESRFTALGVTCVKLVYRTPRSKVGPIWATAWADGQRAIRMIRAEAKARGFNPEKIGAVSMSAGSHLATLLATSALTPAYEKVDALDDTPCHLNWACPFAIAYVLTDGIGKPNATRGESVCVKLSDDLKFDAKTCPMCMCHGGADICSPIAATKIYRKLRSMKIPAELHLLSDRPHCAEGLDRVIEFMRQMEYLGKLEPEVDLYTRFPNDDARASYEKYDIWPEGKIPHFQEHQCVPYLEWHMPKELKTTAIQIIWSGGAYYGNSPDSHEVTPARRYLNERGMAVVTVKYRTPRPNGIAKHVTAWQDIQRAIRLVRAGAASRGLDPNRIGIMGSSAGGHLTLMGATSSKCQAYWPIDDLDKIPCNVQWGIAIYPAYSLTDGLENENAKGGNEDDARLAPEFTFDPATPPMCFIHGDADGWAAMNSVKAWEQLRRMGLQSDLHTLAKRYHCFQFKASPGTGSYTWLDRIGDFLTHKGFDR